MYSPRVQNNKIHIRVEVNYEKETCKICNYVLIALIIKTQCSFNDLIRFIIKRENTVNE